jgi:hypothetical protein
MSFEKLMDGDVDEGKARIFEESKINNLGAEGSSVGQVSLHANCK